MKIYINQREQIDSQLKMLGDMLRQRFVPDSMGQVPGFEITVVPTQKRRTASQNDALHVYCRQLANALNDAGLDMREVIKPEVDIPWNDQTVKEYMWRPIQKVVTGEESTTRPTPKPTVRP